MAIGKSNVTAARFLLSNGANPNVVDEDGYTLRFLLSLSSTFGYFFGSKMAIVLFGRAFYLVDITSTIAIKSRKGSKK
jgi:ankyrin repeat protein